MTHTLSLLLTFILLLHHLQLRHCSAVVDDEIRSLLEFKKGIKIDPLNKIFTTWNETLLDPSIRSRNNVTCPSSFYGVLCDPSSNSITAINLSGLGLSGELKFSTLLPLKSLQNLTLSGNSFTGRLVPAVGTMTTLQHLDLSSNQFVGPIPDRINDLWGLNYLNLSQNNLTGWYPGSTYNLNQLKVMDLHQNFLNGSVEFLFSVLRNVEYVDLSGNSFVGSLALSAQNVSSLANTVQYLNLSGNNLAGGFFTADVMQLFRNLRTLDLGDNGISAELPSMATLPILQVLKLGSNQFYGSIPVELLQGPVPLVELDLSSNQFSNSIQEVNSTTLRTLNLSSNVLSGSLPPSLGNCVLADLSRNMLSDDIRVMDNWGGSLEVLDLSSNNLTGSISNWTLLQRLSLLSFRNNSLVGSVPSELGDSPRLATLDLSSNKLDGSLPGSLFKSQTLTSLNMSGNHLNGRIPIGASGASELLALPSSFPIELLDLSDNSLTGILPSDVGNLGRLRLLNLARNQMSGDLPSELNKINGLEYLDLSNNNFKGKIPDELSSRLEVFNVSYNDLEGTVPENLIHFPDSSFHPGNTLLILPPGGSSPHHKVPDEIDVRGKHHSSKSSIRIAIIVASVGAVVMIAFVLLAYYRAQHHDFRGQSGFSGQTAGRDDRLGRFSRPSLFKFHTEEPPPTSLSFSNDHLLPSNSRSLSGPLDSSTEIVERVLPEGSATGSTYVNPNVQDNCPATSGRKSSPGSPIASSPRFIDTFEQPVILDVYSPDRLAGELFFLDASLAFTAEELSRAPAEVLGRSSHGTLYKATLDNGHMLTVKWLRVGLVKNKKEFAKEVRKIGSIRHPNVVSLRAYYWGPREQERLVLADYIQGDSLALHLYETTPRRYSPLSFSQRVKVAVDVARCLMYLHERGLPHGNLKPTNVILEGPNYNARLTDYCLHRLMTPAGIAEQILNLGTLGYRAPELANATKPMPSFKADVYALGVILMELLTRRSAGDIISGESGAVDLTDWVRLCDQEGRGMDCIDRDIAGGEEHSKAMNDLLAISLRCILPVNERPNIRQVCGDLCSIDL
ncbi:probable inactive receptor kinase At5g10020 [Coffea arabica]|uniref:Probable inactive receptor kinase At5g10020 n=1 Tax=Coffea arabica TaxID=13443 RepID=A0A6P6TJD3_COFAR|nr:probable inactive receptor kinase At5g10020 [Coffea arabica]